MILQPVRPETSRSRPLRGFTRPYQWTPTAETAAPEPAAQPDPPRKPGVLIVEGEGSIRTVLALLLRQHGFLVWQVAGAEAARDLLAEHADAIDIALVDTTTPGIETPGLLQGLREIQPRLCCCLLGGRSGEYGETELRELGVTRFFPRPFQLAEMARELRLVVAEEQPLAAAPEPRALEIDIAEPPGDERRGAVRYRCDLENSCQPLGQGRSGEHWEGQIVDISAGGARVVLSRRFEVGTVLVLAVNNGSGEIAQRLLARVVRVVHEPDGQWSLGCSFNCPLADDDLRDLLG
jgi:CheY-like chemotaxis protein